jgi:predicted alpha/beta hydrolase family esterase
VPSTVLFVPGLRDHVADHWQTLLAAEIPGSRTAPPLTEDKLSRAARVASLDRALAEIEGPVILVAHSAGCLTVAHWAQAHERPIQGALLATPADIERPLPEGYPTKAALKAGGWLPVPRAKLPFPSLVAASSNDPLADLDRTVALAIDWGSELALLGDVGHLNPAAGFGPWPAGLDLIAGLEQRAALRARLRS